APTRGPRPCPGAHGAATSRRCGHLPLFSDDLDQHSLGPPAVELAVEDLLPRAEVELALGYRHHDLAAHDLALVVGVGVVLAGACCLSGWGAGPNGPRSWSHFL